MSGSISSLLGTLGELASIITGEHPVRLGNVQLQHFEVPERITFGGTQTHIRHDFPGGHRVIDAMGAFDADITWSGYFQGSGAVSRARRIDAIRHAGEAVRLNWADITKKVLVTEFQCDYERRGSLLPYRITCVVVSSGASTTEPTLLERLAGDVGSALGVTRDDLTGIMDGVSQATDAAQKALPIVGMVAGPKAMVSASDAIARAGTSAAGLQAALDGRIGGLGTAAQAVGIGGTAGAMQALLVGADALARSTEAAAHLGQAAARIRLG